MRRVCSTASFMLSLLTLAGCPDKEGDSTASEGSSSSSSTGEGSSTGSSTGEGSSTGSSMGEGSSTGEGSSSSGSTTGPIGPVMCGDVLCARGELCVYPGAECDYNQDPPQVIMPPLQCVPVPMGCAPDDLMCVGEAICGPWDFNEPTLAGGRLDCPANFADCF